MKNSYRIRPYAHERLKWVVRGKENGKWIRKFFEKKFEAETFAQFKNTELSNQGTEGASFPTALRVMAQAAAATLQPYGKTIRDAVDFYRTHLDAVANSVSLEAAINELIENRRATGASKKYLYDLKLHLGRLRDDFSQKSVAELTTADLDKWLAGLPFAPVTRNTFRRDVRTLFSFCEGRGYCQKDPAKKTSIAKVVGAEKIGILTADETARLLQAADEAIIPFIAIAAFAGLRRCELLRLDWKNIDLESGLIEVTAKTAKQAKAAHRRHVKILPNLDRWIRPLAKTTGPVACPNLRKLFDAARTAARLIDWPDNALRHSYAGHHLARFQNAAALALEMGNSEKIIFSHYRELVRPKEAARYWGIMPSLQSKKVVDFKMA